jgi:hypothetical protein
LNPAVIEYDDDDDSDDDYDDNNNNNNNNNNNKFPLSTTMSSELLTLIFDTNEIQIQIKLILKASINKCRNSCNTHTFK